MEENGAEKEEGSAASPGDQQGTTPTLPRADTVFTLDSGEKVTWAEINQERTRLEDYTVKTQEAAEEKRQAEATLAEADAVKAEAEGNMAEATAMRTAMEKDLTWYNEHPDVKDWQTYSPEIYKVNGQVGTPAAPPVSVSDPRDAEIAKLTTRVDNIEQEGVQSANERAVDTALQQIADLAGSAGYEVVTPKLLLKSMQAHQAENRGQLPSAAQLKLYAGELQEELKIMGVPIPTGEVVSVNGSTKPRLTGDIAAGVEPAWKQLNLKTDRSKVEDALAAILKEKQDARS